MSTTYKAKYREPFAPGVPGVEFVRFNDVADLRAKFSNDVCAILVEAIQGEGGIRPLTQEFFAEAREARGLDRRAADRRRDSGRHGAHGQVVRLSALRHQAGCHDAGQADRGRHSAWARFSAPKRLRARFTPGMHGTTFGGGPLACAVAIAVIDAIENEGLLTHVDGSRRLLPGSSCAGLRRSMTASRMCAARD